MICQPDYDALLVHLYAGSTDRHRMSEFLLALGVATKSHVTTFVHADLASPAASSLLTAGIGPDEIHRWSEHAGENPWMQRYLPEIHTGGVCNGDEYVDHKELLASNYYDGFLRHIDTQHSVGICAAYERNHAAFLMLCRSGHIGAYDNDCINLFKRLSPHVVNAFELQQNFEHLEAQASLITHRQRGMFLLDSQWNWVGGNSIAEDMVAAGWWRGRLTAHLDAAHPITNSVWKKLQRNFVHEQKIKQTVPVYDTRAQLVAFASVHFYGAAAISKLSPCYVLFVRPLKLVCSETLGMQLRQLFSLTSAEITLVIALRTHVDISNAATAIGIAESSAKTRLQTIFEKTGLHRRIDLLLMIDALSEIAV